MKILYKNNFKTWEKVKNLSPELIIKKVVQSGLEGKGGANFPTGIKWRAAYPADYLICNIDESEPGRFKDKFILENNPELLIEGINITAHALKVKKVFIYLREEYKKYQKKLEDILQENCPYNFQIVIGAGSYICGEETAMLNSIEGQRTESRVKPPYPSEKGLYGKKTCVNNAETLARVPLIWKVDFNKNLMLFSISGDVQKPGIYEEKKGISLGRLLKKAEAKNPKAIFFGASGGVLPYKSSLVLSDKNISKTGAYLEGSIIVLNKKRSVVDICRSIIQFYNEENCGKCLPCREGNFRLLQLFQVILKRKWTKEEFEIIKDLANFIPSGSQCALGKNSVYHLKTALKYFPNEFKKLCK